MTARVFTAADWMRAKYRRAQRGKAPRLSIVRAIVLRHLASGECIVVICTRRYGVWAKPEHWYGPTTADHARAAVVRAWRLYRLPVVRAPPGARHLLPLHLGRDEMRSVVA